MSATFQALDFLCTLDRERGEGVQRACALLPRQPATDFIERLMVEKEQKLGPVDVFGPSLDIAAGAVAAHKVTRSITDWPFEHFWQNPNEPRHSLFLGYLINSNADHGCGTFLLGRLFDTLQLNLPKDNWHVEIERSHIDILLTHDSESERYAIIIENKVNCAKDQPDQLQTYLDDVRNRGFEDKDIYVLYLPLTEAKEPTANSLGNVRTRLGERYRKITFKKHIQGWLDSVLKDPDVRPETLSPGMRSNLSHYHDLITYLLKQQEKRIMDTEIMKKLSEMTTPLPTWSQVINLQKAAEALQPCIESVVRGQLILAIHQLLKTQNVSAVMYDADGVPIPVEQLKSPFAPLFEDEVNCGVQVHKHICVCIGVTGADEPDNGFVFTGFLNPMNTTAGEELNTAVKGVGNQILGERAIFDANLPRWFVYGWDKETTYDNATAGATVSRLTQEFMGMLNGIRRELGQQVT